MRSESPAFWASFLIARVNPRWTGYGAGRGAFGAFTTRTYAVGALRPGRPLNARVIIVSSVSVRASLSV
jgi:hypothetical protein